MNADGSIVINTKVDDEQAAKDLERLKKKIQKLEDQIYTKKQQRMPLVEQSKQMAAELDAAKAKLEEMRSGKEFFTSAQIKDQASLVEQLQKDWDSVQNRVEQYDRNIEKSSIELDLAKERAGGLERNIVHAEEGTHAMAQAVATADSYMKKFTNRVKGLAKRVFIFTIITTALRSIRRWMGEVLKTNDDAVAAISQLKGALLTLAQPLVDVIIPAMTSLIRLLARIVTVAAQVVAMLFGTTIKKTSAAAKALNEEKEALEGVGEAAANLSGLDEINTWNSGAGAGSGNEISPDFDLAGMTVAEGKLDDIFTIVTAIGMALLTWRIGKALHLGVEKSVALFAILFGTIMFVKNIFDAWSNGVSWSNLLQTVAALVIAVLGLNAMLGPTAAGIGLIVGGLAMMVTGFKDAMNNGWGLANTFMVIAGIVATGLGISLLVGSMIPLLIAGIAALLVALTVFTGNGEDLLNGLKDVFGGFIDFVTGVFSGDWNKAMGGIERIFRGLALSLDAIIKGVKDTFLSLLDWIDEKTGGRLKPALDVIRGIVSGVFDAIRWTIENTVNAIKQIFTGIVMFISGVFTNDWERALEGVKNIFRGMWNGIVSLLEGAVNLVVRGVNWLISQLNRISFTVPGWVPGVGGRSIGIDINYISEASIPRLAKGAVIPPNREFMAVLGDQKNGTNIETPEGLLRQIVREEGGSRGGSYQFTAMINRKVLFNEMIEEGKLRQTSTGKNPFTAF